MEREAEAKDNLWRAKLDAVLMHRIWGSLIFLGIAFVPCDTFTPVSLLYTMIERPETLVIDVLFAAKVPENRRVEVSIILSELNADQTAGAFQLDPNSGYVYYRQSFVLEGMDLTEAQFAQLMKNIETVAVETAEAYSHIMETEYPK